MVIRTVPGFPTAAATTSAAAGDDEGDIVQTPITPAVAGQSGGATDLGIDDTTAQAPLEEDALIEEVSIDGMCGVY
ncbi:mycofactocin precursor MftA [Parafrankia elaeagni]|uniref:mycofactocin precursor MftA n=1 Tax=Parafrankia elaeagni TaxID=222534 RepID=UPI0003717CA5|nr:mycofactocin precursor MftA [Parafrankia elaeagni]